LSFFRYFLWEMENLKLASSSWNSAYFRFLVFFLHNFKFSRQNFSLKHISVISTNFWGLLQYFEIQKVENSYGWIEYQNNMDLFDESRPKNGPKIRAKKVEYTSVKSPSVWKGRNILLSRKSKGRILPRMSKFIFRENRPFDTFGLLEIWPNEF
jgi:hypothetical protein